MRGSNMQSLVKNGSQTSLDSKAFILLHVMQLKCSARSQKSALSSSCYRAHFWGALISNIAHEGGT